MSYCVGVDLGTTSVTAAVCDEAGVRVVTLGDRSADTPSAVYLQHDGMLITGRRAASKSVTNPGRVARQFTRLLGSAETVLIGGQRFTPSELLGVLLGNVVQHVTRLEGSPPDAAVLTHPVGWGPEQLELLREVAAGAGLADPVLVSAPSAVAAHWAASRDADTPGTGSPTAGAGARESGDAAVAVYGLGGGTFDAAVLRGPDWSPADGAVGRDLGGMDFDELLVGLVDSSLGGAVSKLDVTDPSNATALARIRQDCIRAKEALTGVPEAYVPVFLPGRHADVRVRRTDLEKLLGARITATADELGGALKSADVDVQDLAAVLLVGGSARIPLVARTVSERLGRAVTVDADSVFSVAAGAATIGGAARGWPVGGRTSAQDPGEAAGAAGDAPGAVTRGRHAGTPTGTGGSIRPAHPATSAGPPDTDSVRSHIADPARPMEHARDEPASGAATSSPAVLGGDPMTAPAVSDGSGSTDAEDPERSGDMGDVAEPAEASTPIIPPPAPERSSDSKPPSPSAPLPLLPSPRTPISSAPAKPTPANPTLSGSTHSTSSKPPSSNPTSSDSTPANPTPSNPTLSGSGTSSSATSESRQSNPGSSTPAASTPAASTPMSSTPASPTPTPPLSAARVFAPAWPTPPSRPPGPDAAPTPPAPPLPPPSGRRGYTAKEAKRRRLLAITGGVLAVVVIGLWLVRPWQDTTPPGPSTAALVLNTNVVHSQESYFAYASGFQPDEPVQLSWTGPTSGDMGAAVQADSTGAVKHGPIMERDPPGAYKVVAHGTTSGWTATAPLQVLPER